MAAESTILADETRLAIETLHVPALPETDGPATRPLRVGRRSDAPGVVFLDHAGVGASCSGAADRAPVSMRGDRAAIIEPAIVPKPWGEERWYSGIEARGVARVDDGAGAVPLHWLLAAMPDSYGAASPVLVKILAPHAEPDRGDLYFEVHARKHECYVVLDVDRRAWPDGVGGVRLGFSAAARAALGDAELRRLYVERAERYRMHMLRAHGTEALATSGSLARSAREAREELESLVEVRRVRVGDVIDVPVGTPHGLLHGVRVLEVQTPTYERSVLHAHQPLANDAAWDTDRAARIMHLAPPPPPVPRVLPAERGVRVEEIVRGDDFRVLRLRLEAGASASLPAAAHGVLVASSGLLRCIDGPCLAAHSAAFLSRCALAKGIRAEDEASTALLALPADRPTHCTADEGGS